MDFTRICKTALLLEILFFKEVPGSSDFLTDKPLVYEKLPGKIRAFAMSPLGAAGGGSCRIPARPAAGVEGKGAGKLLEAHLRAIWVLGWGREALSGSGHGAGG
jgi:hypothetical protein